MGIINFLKLILESLKPYRYKGLTQRSILKTFIFFLVLSLVYLLLIGAVNTPRYYSNYVNAGSNTSGLERFSINIDISTNEPVIVSETPKIIIDTSENRSLHSKEDVVITKDTMYSKLIFWTKKTEYSNYDILSNLNNLKRNSFLLILVFIPSILVFAYLFILLKYFAIAMIFGFLAGIYVLIRRRGLSVLDVFKTAIYSLTIYFIANIVSSIIRVRYIGIIIYTLFFVVAIFFARDDGVIDSVFGDN